ncbi:MAG: DUF4974 domain-containing protein [Bacteroidetes bacterium]|nr:DUF4974 domain-containing protein [Bacteroidota bacterium]
MSAISEELLDKFLKGLCTEEEAEIVEAYFQQHPEEIFLLDAYEAADGAEPLPEGYSEEMLEAIIAETGGEVERPARVRAMRVWVAAAACVLVLVTGWLLLKVRQKNEGQEKAPQVAAVWVAKHNADSKKIRLQLPDSSEMILSPDATIRYRQDFGKYDRREVHVDGQATFTVIKDKNIPFVVYSQGLRTTVMGTIFEVTAEKSSDQIKVRLMEGNVIIRVDSLVKDSTKNYFLSPGEEFIYGKWNKSVVIQQIKPINGGGYALSRVSRLPGSPDSLSNWYMFNNQPLADVFDQLSILYNTDIQYSSGDLRNKYFIGKLEKKDSLTKIMRDIALLNHLSVTILNGRYVVVAKRR